MSIVGQLLRSERLKKGVEPSDVERETGIRSLYVTAIEEGRFEVLPGEVYTKGFIRNYATYLGLDGTKMIRLYTDGDPEVQTDVSAVSAERSKSTISSNSSALVWCLAILIIFAVAGAGYYWWISNGGKLAAGKSDNSVRAASPVVPSSGGAIPSPVVKTPEPIKPVSSRPVVLSARYTQRCWTSVSADGRVVFEGVPVAGDTLTWEADRQIFVNFGNAAAVELTFNGKPVGKIGEQGEVINRTFQAPTSPSRT